MIAAMLMVPGVVLAMAVSSANPPQPGISLALAESRAASVRELRYDLNFDIPRAEAEPVRGRERIRFTLAAPTDIVIDFSPPRDHVTAFSVNGREAAVDWINGHLVVPQSLARAGENEIAVEFVAGDVPLNRSADFMYTLFVPARGSQTFPCFDQPDLKAKFTLTLTAPADWQVVANGAETSRDAAGDRVTVRFTETAPLPTYLFAFAAGKFSVEEADRNGRHFRMFHRETDAAKVARNRDAIFDLHAAAIKWLEDYTGIPYPFGKFDFVLVPSFQFGGMEHAGAIFYNASGLLLDETATQNQKLGRASVIAHETSHMWFGDLVTMRWFNDVWMKEVFANFMAAKIVNPSFPGINHELRFLLAHYPAAYEVDRTQGTNAIRQSLANLNEAGTLYGAIIYEKAPIVMRQLEERLGEGRMRDGLRRYLEQHAFGNATWTDLIAILDALTPEDLARWSRAWVSEEGRPQIRTDVQMVGGKIARLAFTQSDRYARRGLTWPQRLHVVLGYPDRQKVLVADLEGRTVVLDEAAGMPAPLYVLPDGEGRAYGGFTLDPGSLEYLRQHVADIPDPLTRGSAWVTMWEAMLQRDITPTALMETALASLPRESDELNVQRVLTYLQGAWWKFLTDDQRLERAPRVDGVLRAGIAAAATPSLKSAWFSAFRNTTLTADGVAFLERVWDKKEAVPGLTFSENDEIDMAQELALRGIPRSREILEGEAARIKNPDRKARFEFVMAALASDVETRDRFFASLADPANRRHEPWVLDGLRFIHHPLRGPHSEQYILPSLQMLREIQRTGDIFLPKRWMDATLGGHSSPSAAAIVKKFVDALPQDYPTRLRKVILSAADDLFRAAEIQGSGLRSQPRADHTESGFSEI